MRRNRRTAEPPAGLHYRADLVERDEERELISRVQDLPFEEFQFHGFVGKRRVISYGWQYDFGDGKLRPSAEIPAFLLALREKAASFGELAATDLPHALITEYSPGTAIGWHRDRGVFGDVVGISLRSSCVFRLRRKRELTWERYSFIAEPRSAYSLRGEARTEWEHSIPAVPDLRYSITFRTVR